MGPGPAYYVGLTLAAPQDCAGVALLERAGDAAGRRPYRYAARHLERFPPGAPYADLFGRAAELINGLAAGGTLVVDRTQVDRPVLALVRRAGVKARVVPVAVTARHEAALDGRGGWAVPRAELVGALQVLLQSRRLLVAPALAEAAELGRQLAAFRPRPAVADLDGIGRGGPQEGLALAVAVAAWAADRVPVVGAF